MSSLKSVDTSIDDDLVTYLAIASGYVKIGGVKTGGDYGILDTISKFIEEVKGPDRALTTWQVAKLAELTTLMNRLCGAM